MEKTVDINENSQFLEHLPSFTEETIPDLSQDLFGSFKLQGTSNPLEQLGLYMKADDEDEDDEEEELNTGERSRTSSRRRGRRNRLISKFLLMSED
ncbi:hypothetical protein SLA2020_442670 [Shorea laevis]